MERLPDAPEPGLVTVTCGCLTDGFVTGGAGLVLLTEADLTGNRAPPPPTRARSAAAPPQRRRPVTLQPGDHVVHAQHGIGRFVEMRERTVGGATREYLVLEYASSKRGQPADRLFVPTDALDEVSRYVGGETPTLNKLGGADWAKTKGRARRAVRQIAAKLVQLYAARQAAPGHAFGADTPWQRELEDAFPFTETPDQLVGDRRGQGRHGTAGADGPGDLRRRRVRQDRDRGAGGVQGGAGRQAGRGAGADDAAGRSSTCRRSPSGCAPFPVNVKGLSRFTDNAEAKQTIAGLADGTVDIVIGTHRLLQRTCAGRTSAW